jgi:hypothetical protein
VLVGRGAVADDPVDLLAVLVDEKIRRRRVDVKSLVDRVADLVAGRGPVDDDLSVEKIGVFGIVVELLNQQSAAPSATRVEVDENELVLFLGFGQRLVERSGEDRGRLGGGEGGDEEETGEGGELFHAVLLGKTSCPGQDNGTGEGIQSSPVINKYAAGTAKVAGPVNNLHPLLRA